MKEKEEEDILGRLRQVEVDLLNQEHRITRVIFNIYKHGLDNSDERKRNAVWLALISYFLRQRTITIIISAVSGLGFLVTTYILLNQNRLMEQQNELIAKQNKRLDQQTYLQEAERRSSLVFQLGNILDAIDREVKSDVGTNEIRDISSELIGRIISLSGLLRPYRYLENDSLIQEALSPERGQLLVSLLNSEIDINTLRKIYTSANFSYADMKNSRLTHFDLNQARLMSSDFRGAYVLSTSFSNGKLMNCKFDRASLTQTNFDGATLSNSSLIECDLSYSSFAKADLENVNLTRANLSGTVFYETNLKNAILDSVIVHDRELLSDLQEGPGGETLKRYRQAEIRTEDGKRIDHWIILRVP